MTTKQAKRKKSRLWTDRHLREWFDLANARYFKNRLKVMYIEFGTLPNGYIGNTHAITYRTLYGPRNPNPPIHWRITIGLSLRSSRSLSVMTLIHEMVHVEQKNQYSCGLNGHRFNRRMKELAAAGAFNGLW